MPELPEVETVKRGISDLSGKTISKLVIRNHSLRYKISTTMPDEIQGKTINRISRRAKYLILELTTGYIIIHLGMSGSITLLRDSLVPIKKHDHFDIVVENYILRYNDPRRFGLIMYVDSLDKCSLLTHLGPEPLEEDFSAKYLLDKLKNRKSTIKQLIMDNKIVVGVGNIYACEALFLAKISPLRLGTNITLTEATLFVKTIKQVLSLAIEKGGSTLRDHKQADGTLGYFQNSHNVYAKSGKPCVTCSTTILEHRLGQRNSFYCPKCQK